MSHALSPLAGCHGVAAMGRCSIKSPAMMRSRNIFQAGAQLPLMRQSSTTSGGNACVKRLTLFKIPKEEDIDRVLKQYEVLRRDAVKDGKPYIVSNTARKVINNESPLSNGFTLVSQSIFKDYEDHEFYDKHCPAHKELKKVTSAVRTGIMTLVTEGEWPELRL